MWTQVLSWRRLLDDYRVFPVLLVAMTLLPLALWATGCGGDDGDDGGLSPVQQQIATYNESFERFRTAISGAASAAMTMEQIVTDHGIYDLNGAPGGELTNDEMVSHAEALERSRDEYRAAFLASYDMVKAAKALETEQQAQALWFDLPGELEQGRYPELFTLTGMLLLSAGVSLATWVACKSTESHLTKACENVKNKLMPTQNETCLKAYARELHVPGWESASKEDILEHIENHPGRAKYCTQASIDMQLLVTEGELAGTNCLVPSAQEITQTRFEVTQDVVETGANYNVAMLTTVTSTPTSLLVGGAKVSEGAKVATELGIAVTETAMQEYGSTLPEEVTVTGVSDDTTLVEMPKSSSTNTPEQAASVVADKDALLNAVNEAFDDVAVDVANTAGMPLTTTGYDGANSIDVPNHVFVGTYPIVGLQDTVTIGIPNIGFGTVMVFSPGKVPEVTPDLNTAENNQIDLSSIDISQWGEEPSKKKDDDPPVSGSGLTVMVPQGNHVAGFDVTLTVHCPENVTFPATLDSNSMSGVSLSWASVTECPVLVVFNADNAGSYTVNLTLKDAGGKKYQGSATVVVVAPAEECQQGPAQDCANALFEDSSCWASCPPEQEDDREYQACNWYCSASKAQAEVQCAYQFGCINQYTYYRECTAKCNFAFAACLNAINSSDPSFMGSCPAEQGACLAPCMDMI